MGGEKKLNHSIFEKRFKNLFAEAPFSAALLSGDDFIIEMVNEESLKLWGKDNDIIGKPFLQAMPEMIDQLVFKKLQESYRSGETYEGKEHIAYLREGETVKKVYVNFTLKPIRDDDAKITSILAVGYDVTDQVTARQKLEASEARVRLIIDSVGLGTFEKDLLTDETTASPRFNSIFGYTSTVPHEEYQNRIHPEDTTIRDEAQREALVTGKLFYEARLLFPDHTTRWIKINGLFLYDEEKKPIRLIGTALDITEEKLSLLKLQESEERFRTLITETPEVGAGLYIGRELRIQYVNDVMLKFWNKDQSIIGKTMGEVLPIPEGQPFLDQFAKVFDSGEAVIGKEEKAYLEVNGKTQPTYFNYTYKPLRNHSGDIYAIHHMAVDVTAQVENKLALIESEESVRRLFTQTPVGLGVFKGRELIIEMINPSLLTYCNAKYDEVINKPLWQALPELKEQGLDKIAQQVFETGVPFTSPETTISFKRNGITESLIVYFGLQPQKDSHGNIVGLLVIANDITDLVIARKKVEKNEMRLQDLANSMPQVVWIAEADGRVTYYNGQVTTFGGVKKEGDTWIWEGTVHPEDSDRTTKAWRKAIQDITYYQVEHRILMNDGSYRWHLSRAFPYEREEGIRWYGTATDVHDQKILEMNLENIVRERTSELERSNEDLQQFAHVASHDLKEPVRKIKTFAFKLQDEFKKELNDRGNNFINKIIRSADRMYSMINGVLKYASMPHATSAFESVDLNNVIKNITNDLEILIEEKNAKIFYTNLPIVHAIPDLIHQLFYNLINNSLKFSKASVPSEIQLQCTEVTIEEKEFYRITVSDNGIGFEDHYAEQVFQTFFRLNSKDKYEGSGLGLALCKKIVERHHGFISATGEQDKGSEFIITLPK
ncbi:PAS domain-containing sensor histidine kinase [Chryseosolibacter indicus]|uniref:histidine kinase n=1 Tax=Chryseosolibacter indicus TaxID=2782351 RepID=A0ABS5VSW7_9BACT|nr:PAS domain-containing protein [Chryseosolibacter indicus]MBT1704123.1 PAS domain-containing protein [Chryseosolibacter indicus]